MDITAMKLKVDKPPLVYTFTDITAPDHGVQVVSDEKRKVLYVHVDGVTVLRICQIPKIEYEFIHPE